MLLDIDVSYVPTRRERRRALYSSWFVWTVCAGLAGAPVAISGIGALARSSAGAGAPSGGTAMIAVVGVAMMLLPLALMWRIFSDEASTLEHRILLDDSGLRIEIDGVVSDVAWRRIISVRETSEQWLFTIYGHSHFAIPKRVIPDDQNVALSDFLQHRDSLNYREHG